MPTVIHSFGPDVSTDVIYPGRFMATVLPAETPQFAFADERELNARLKTGQIPPGSVILAGRNFGCGSSREQAVSCLKGHELCLVAQSFARIFLQNAINLGLKVVTCPDLIADVGDELEISATEVRNVSCGFAFAVVPLPESRQAIIDAGGLISYTRRRLVAAATA